MDYIIRQMQDGDIPYVIEIDREAFPTQWPHPTYASLKQELRNRLARYIVAGKPKEPETTRQDTDRTSFWEKLIQLKHLFNHDRFFGEEKLPAPKDYVIGIAGFWVMADEAHITTIAVRDAYRQQGIGERLLISIIEMAVDLKASVVTLEVRASNRQAQALYDKYGFRRVGTRRAYYTDNGEDALLMTTDSLTSANFQSHLQKLKDAHQLRWGALLIDETSKAIKQASYK